MRHGWLLSLMFGCVRPPPASMPALVADGLAQELATEGGLGRRLSDAPADLVLIYGGEQGGRVGPCGCEERPKGGLPRAASYIEAVRARDARVVVVNAGGFLADFDGGASERARNALVVEGLRVGGWDAWNVTRSELRDFEAWGWPAEAVSATHAGPGQAVWQVSELGGLRVAVTGVDGSAESAMTSLQTALAGRPEEPTIVVVLAHGAFDPSPLARLPGVDVLVHAGAHAHTYPPRREGEAVLVKSRAETRRLGELRLQIEGGRVVGALDRQIDLDAGLPDHPALRPLLDEAYGFGEARPGR